MKGRHEVLLEHDGTRALERLLSDEEIDTTFLDLMLGVGPSGLQILAKLQELAPARLERLVVCTGAIGIPGIEEELGRYRVPTTGKPLLVIEKPYSIPQIDHILRQFMACTKPRGPRYSSPPDAPETPRPLPPRPRGESRGTPHAFPRQPHPSQPRLPDYDEKEVSAVTQLADAHDPVGIALRDNRRDVKELAIGHGERLAKLEAHFEDNGPGKRGLVRQIDVNVTEIRSGFALFKVALPIVAILLAGLMWVIAAVQPKPERIDYNRIQRDMATSTVTAPTPK